MKCRQQPASVHEHLQKCHRNEKESHAFCHKSATSDTRGQHSKVLIRFALFQLWTALQQRQEPRASSAQRGCAGNVEVVAATSASEADRLPHINHHNSYVEHQMNTLAESC